MPDKIKTRVYLDSIYLNGKLNYEDSIKQTVTKIKKMTRSEIANLIQDVAIGTPKELED